MPAPKKNDDEPQVTYRVFAHDYLQGADGQRCYYTSCGHAWRSEHYTTDSAMVQVIAPVDEPALTRRHDDRHPPTPEQLQAMREALRLIGSPRTSPEQAGAMLKDMRESVRSFVEQDLRSQQRAACGYDQTGRCFIHSDCDTGTPVILPVAPSPIDR
jgi:hypothetical protein